jgi:hypothetical protein
LHFPDDGLLDVFGVVPVGQVQEDREPCRAFHERADRAFVGRAADQVAFPMTGYRPVLDFGGPLADHDHGFAETGLARVRLPVRPALGAPAPQGLDDVLFQFAFGLDVDGLVDRLRAHMHSIIIREIGAQAPRDLLGTPMRPQSCANVCEQAGHRMDLRGLGSSGPSALICWGRYGSYMPVAGFVLRTSSRLAVDAGRLSVRAIPRTLMPAFRQSAMLMRSSWLRYLELIFWGMSTVERYQSTDGFSFLPFDRVLPLRHTLPVRLDTPTARAACVKFMPASRCSTYRRRRAAHISPRVAYSTPSNTHLSTWPSHQSARRCDDHWNPPFAIFFGGGERPVAASVRWESDASSLRMMRRFIPLADG